MTAIGATVVMLAGMAYGYLGQETYALIITDDNGNDYITDQYLSWDDCQGQPHTECRPMSEILTSAKHIRVR